MSVVANNRTKSKEWLVLLGIVGLVGFVNLNFVFENNTASVYIIASLLLCLLIYACLVYKNALLYFLSFCIPISVGVSFGETRISGPSEFICAVLAVYYGIRYFSGHRVNREFLKHPITLVLLVDALWLLATSALSQMPEVSYKRWIIRFVYLIVYYFMFGELFQSDSKKIVKVLLYYCLGLTVPIVYYLFQHQQINFAIQGSTKFSQPFYNDHTVFGAILVFMLPFLTYFTFRHLRDSSTKLFYVFFFLLVVVAAFFSYSRAAWLSLFIAFAIYFVIKYEVKRRTVIIWVLIAGLALFFVAGQITENLSRNRVQSHGKEIGQHFKSVTNISTDASNVERINRWKCAYRMFLDKPILGFGPGTYQFYYGNYQISTDFNDNSTYSGDKGHAHSEYLNYLSETGIIGLLIFLSSILLVWRTAIRVIYNNNNVYQVSIVLVLFMGLVTFYIHSFFNGFIESDKMAMPVFTSMAAITVLDVISKKRHVI